MTHIYKLHGLPASIISDRDPVFTSHSWQELFKYAGTNLNITSAYHPRSDGQTERVNQCLETYLRCFVSACPKRWSLWITLAQFWYNSTMHSAIGMSPFKAMYGHEPRHWGIDEGITLPVINLHIRDTAHQGVHSKAHQVYAGQVLQNAAQVKKHDLFVPE